MNSPDAFRAIADPTRREIIGLLAEREMTLSEVASRFEMSRPAVAKHMAALEAGGLLHVRRVGRERRSALRAEGLKTVADWLAHYSRFWDDKLDRLKQAVEAEDD